MFGIVSLIVIVWCIVYFVYYDGKERWTKITPCRQFLLNSNASGFLLNSNASGGGGELPIE